jgi:hypothetical protein
MPKPNWNPDTACEEMAALFDRADQITSKPIYQVQASTEPTKEDAGSTDQTTEEQSQGH